MICKLANATSHMHIIFVNTFTVCAAPNIKRRNFLVNMCTVGTHASEL